ncbi:DUF2732 family protein [Erwinia aphidicola]|uniref:DUF2732 family protein n=1 Tax=Erwinia TaxID=551 RepID=UPI0010621775
MKNLETRLIEANAEVVLHTMLMKANSDGQKAKSLCVSIRLNALAIHIQQMKLPAAEAAALLVKEALRYECEAEEVH